MKYDAQRIWLIKMNDKYNHDYDFEQMLYRFQL